MPLLPHNDVLTNGLRVVTVPMPHLHTASVHLYVKVGSRFESASDSGLSHFLEHMLFRGTEAHPSSYALNFAVERLGGTLDAETGRDCSLYPLSVAPELVGEAVELLAEVVRRPRFDDIDLEREIILEEIGEDFDEDGVEINTAEIGHRLIFGDHALGRRITGPRENIERFTVDDLRRRHGQFYVARNMVLAVAGPVEPAAVRADAERHLGDLQAGDEVEVDAPAFDQTGPRYEYAQDSGTQTQVTLVFRGLSELDADYVTSLAMRRLLDDGMATRLHYRLCDQLGLAYAVGAGIEPLHDTSLFELEGTTSHAKVTTFLREAFALLAALRSEPCTPDELDKLKRRFRHEIAASCDDADAMASWFGGTTLYRRPPSLQQRADDMDAVTAGDIQRVAGRILRPERFAGVAVGGLGARAERQARKLIEEWRPGVAD